VSSEYRSHLTVLAGILEDEKPKRILEYGAGIHSTPFFLKDPNVRQLVSVEPDPDWRHRILTDYADPRLHILGSGDWDFDPADFDLVFVDNGQDGAEPLGAERVATLKAVLSVPHPTVVVHDADVPEYAAVIDDLATNYRIYPTGPDTAVIEATDK
jgi:predicted O-methyltransferase YrrM